MRAGAPARTPLSGARHTSHTAPETSDDVRAKPTRLNARSQVPSGRYMHGSYLGVPLPMHYPSTALLQGDRIDIRHRSPGIDFDLGSRRANASILLPTIDLID